MSGDVSSHFETRSSDELGSVSSTLPASDGPNTRFSTVAATAVRSLGFQSKPPPVMVLLSVPEAP